MPDPAFLLAFNARVLPALDNDGFSLFAPQHYGRIRGDVFQYLNLHLDAGAHPHFLIEFGTLLLVEPHAFLNLDLGGRFPDGTNGKVYAAHSPEALNDSLEAVLIDYFAVGRPALERVSTLEGVIAATQVQLDTAVSPHPLFTLAAAYARLDRLDEAQRLARQAQDGYSRIYGDSPANTWALKGTQRCFLLLESMLAGDTAALQDGWRERTIEALGIGGLDTPTAGDRS